MCCHRNQPHVAQHLDCLGSLLPHKTRSRTRLALELPLAHAACNQILDQSTGEAGTTQTRSPTPGKSNRCRERKTERVRNMFSVSPVDLKAETKTNFSFISLYFSVYLTIRLMRTKSSGFLAQAGSSTSHTGTPSSRTPSSYSLLLTNISGK